MSFDPGFLLLFPVFVLSIVVHECAHGWMALRCGDTTARDMGRLTLNPLPHVDPMGSIILPVLLLLFHSPVLFGWAKPVPIDWARLRRPRPDQLKVALAGPASNFLLALCFAALARMAPEHGFFSPLREIGVAGVMWNCALGLFNLIPVPPLDGSCVLMHFLPLKHIVALQQFRLVGLVLIMLVLSQRTLANAVLYTPLRVTVNACLSLFGLPREGLAL